MSDSPCNYCELRRFKRESRKAGHRLTVIKEEGWPTVYVHPSEVDIAKLTHKQKKPYFRMSFMELPDHCCC